MEVEKGHKCLECGKRFTVKCSLIVHLRTHSGDKPFQCPTCSRRFTQSGHFKEHIRTHTGERPYQCATCGKAFTNGSRLRAHMRAHTPRNASHLHTPLHSCPTCHKTFHHITMLRTHQATIHEGKAIVKKRCPQSIKRFSCELCGAGFRAKQSLKAHLITHTGHRPHVCSHCSKGFTHLCHLREHMLTHNSPMSHKCKVCGAKCKSATHARKHAKSHSTSGGGVMYKCSVCNENFPKLDKLKTHMQRHTGEKIFKCGICSRSFGGSSLLVGHMRTHSGERPFECNICSKRFAQSSVLRCHLKMHAGDKRHVCDVCNKRFITQSDVVKHSRVHTKEKPFACQFCNSCFRRSNHLSRHVKIHFRSKETIRLTDAGDAIQTNNIYTESNPMEQEQENGSFLKVNSLFGYFESIERSSMKTIQPDESFHQNRFEQSENNFMNFEKTLGLEEEHRLNNFVIEDNQHERDQYETNNEVRNQCQKNGGSEGIFDSYINIEGILENVVERIHRVIVPTSEVRMKVNYRWRYPNTGAHLKNSCKEVSNKTMDNSKPWQCGICDVSFKEQILLKEHINEHKSVMPSIKYTKLIKNSETGKLEEKDVIPRLKLKLVSKEIVEPIINAHFAKDKIMDDVILTNEEQNGVNSVTNIANNQFEHVKEFSDWSHERQNYRESVIIEREGYFKECQEKQTTGNFERSQVIMDVHNYKADQIINESETSFVTSDYLQEDNHADITNIVPNTLDHTAVAYVYQENNGIEQNIPCQDILDIPQYEHNGSINNIDSTTHLYPNHQGEYLQINQENNVSEINHTLNYVYEHENNDVIDSNIVTIHQESVQITNDILKPIEYIYEHKKGFVAQRMSLMQNENIQINNNLDETINYDYQEKDLINHEKDNINNEIPSTTNYIYHLKDTVVIERDISEGYENMIANIQQPENEENPLFNIHMQCQKGEQLMNKIDFESTFKRSSEYRSVLNHKPVDLLAEDTCEDTCLGSELVKTDGGLCQTEFSFLVNPTEDDDMLVRDKPLPSEEIGEINSGALLEDSYDNIDSLPTINPATQELQESFSCYSTVHEDDDAIDSVLRKNDNKKLSEFTCEDCCQIFEDSNSLVIHMKSHNGKQQPFECNQCSCKFTQQCHLERHLLLHTDQKKHRCHVCGRGFGKASHLKTHLKIHSDEKEFQCNLCNKSYKHRLSWQLHQNTHKEDTTYMCDICGKGFRHPTTLVTHQRTHTGNKPYSCTACEASFSQLSTLISHKRKHTDSRPHVCPQCSKAFRSMGSLNKHIQSHSGIRNFACFNPGCSKTFMRKSHLQRHMSTHKLVDSIT